MVLSESDGRGENSPGLTVSLAEASNGSVSITSQEGLVVRMAVAGGVSAVVRVTSVNGNLEVVDPGAGAADAIQATGGVALSAGGDIASYKFFQGPSLIEYRAGGSYGFALPGSLTADTIVLETGGTISIPGRLSRRIGWSWSPGRMFSSVERSRARTATRLGQ